MTESLGRSALTATAEGEKAFDAGGDELFQHLKTCPWCLFIDSVGAMNLCFVAGGIIHKRIGVDDELQSSGRGQ